MLLRKTENKQDHRKAQSHQKQSMEHCSVLFIEAVLQHTSAQHEGDTDAPMGLCCFQADRLYNLI